MGRNGGCAPDWSPPQPPPYSWVVKGGWYGFVPGYLCPRPRTQITQRGLHGSATYHAPVGEMIFPPWRVLHNFL